MVRVQRRRGPRERGIRGRCRSHGHQPGLLGRRGVVGRVGRRRLALGVTAAVPAGGGGGGRRGGRHGGGRAGLRDGAQLALDPGHPGGRRQDVTRRQRGLRPRRGAVVSCELLG